MRRLTVILGCALSLCFSSSVSAAASGGPPASVFDMFFEEAGEQLTAVGLRTPSIDFIIRTMKQWGEKGITLTEQDIAKAMKDDISLCIGKTDAAGSPLNGDNRPSCSALITAIKSLVKAEREAQRLGDDLLIVAGASELAIADEAHRPSPIGYKSAAFSAMLKGAKSTLRAWPKDTDAELLALFAALEQEMNAGTLDQTVWRFHNGYYRDVTEGDPALAKYGKNVEKALLALANKIGINPQATDIAEFITPARDDVPNIALWARTDDIGIHFIFPAHFPRFDIQPAKEYPVFKVGGETLAYPYSYARSGNVPPAVALYREPLCSRVTGSGGYLCRRVPATPPQCSMPKTPGTIMLTVCDERSQSFSSPPNCSAVDQLFTDDGAPLSSKIPGIHSADPQSICSPDTRILYGDSLIGHACYITQCVQQSTREHSLIGGRTPVVSMETTSPFLPSLRPDPQLGMYTEAGGNALIRPLPEYLGPSLVADIEREYCNTLGAPPPAQVGLCQNNKNTIADAPLTLLTETIFFGLRQETALSDAQSTPLTLGIAAGLRLSLDQTLPLYAASAESLAEIMRGITSLFKELPSAAITRTACPWVGTLSSSSSAAP